MFLRLSLIFALMTTIVAGQTKTQDFAVDASKPYVYVKFDHVGQRKDIAPGEYPTGLWLRLVNNCRIPITVTANDLGTGEPGVMIGYEVIRSLASSSVLSRQANQSPENVSMPRGYSTDVGSPKIIQPGGNLLFVVPSNAVTRNWYLQVRFDFELPGNQYAPQPYSLVSFTWSNIPEKDRGEARP